MHLTESRESGFTLIELAVIIAIICTVAALLLPALSRVRQKAAQTRWESYSHEIRKDPTLDLYYTLDEDPLDGVEIIENKAVGDPSDSNYVAEERNGVFPDKLLLNSYRPEWKKNQGRFARKNTLFFDGSAYVPLKHFYGKEALPAVTVCAWVKSNSPSDQIIVSFDESQVFRLALKDTLGNYAAFDTSSPSRTSELRTSTSYTDDKWHLIIGWYDSDATSEQKRIYIDGVKIELSALSGDTGSIDNAHLGEGIGKGTVGPDQGCPGENRKGYTYGMLGTGSEAHAFDPSLTCTVGPPAYFNGYIDEVSLFKRALTEAEIRDMYRQGRPLND